MNSPFNIYFNINKLSLIIVLVLCDFWAVIALQDMGILIPFLREILGFLLLTFVPGLLIIVIFRLRFETIGEIILYCIGLSISFLALVGLFANLLYLAIGIEKVLEPKFFMLNLTLTLLILIGFSLKVDTSPFQLLLKLPHNGINCVFKDLPLLLLAILLPLLSILAACIMNYYYNNSLIILLLFILAMLPIIALTKNISTTLYPLLLFSISLSLLLHRNLISNYIIGADQQITYFYSNLIKTTLSWDPQIGGHNTIIIVTMVPAIYSLIININLHLVFKVIYSFLYSLCPVGLFYAFRKAFGDKEAFLAGVFFSFYWRFFHDTPGKEAMAHFFIVLFLMLITNTTIPRLVKKFFAIIFLSSMVLSHYGTSFIFLIAIAIAYVILLCIRTQAKDTLLSLDLIILFSTIWLGWFIYTGQCTIFSNITSLIFCLKDEVMSLFTEVKPRTGLYLLITPSTLLKKINLIIYIIFTFFISLGILKFIMDIARGKPQVKTKVELGIIAVPNFLFLCSALFMYGPQFGIDRMYYLSSLLLCPFLSEGYKLIAQLYKVVRYGKKTKIQELPMNSLQKYWTSNSQNFNPFPLSILLAISLLFNSGLIYYIAGVPISSAYTLNKDANGLAYTDAEMMGAKWLDKNIIKSYVIYSDWYSIHLLHEFFPPGFSDIKVYSLQIPYTNMVLALSDLPQECLIYIRSKSINDLYLNDPTYLSSLKIQELEIGCHKVYNNEGTIIFQKCE